jgi:hypothetical protein
MVLIKVNKRREKAWQSAREGEREKRGIPDQSGSASPTPPTFYSPSENGAATAAVGEPTRMDQVATDASASTDDRISDALAKPIIYVSTM